MCDFKIRPPRLIVIFLSMLSSFLLQTSLGPQGPSEVGSLERKRAASAERKITGRPAVVFFSWDSWSLNYIMKENSCPKI